MESVCAVILDSGVKSDHEIFKGVREHITEYTFDGSKWLQKASMPVHGHGTAITSIIMGKNQYVNVISFQIFSEKLSIEPGLLYSALSYIYDNISCNVICLSLGMKVYDERLERLCDKLSRKGVLLVSAFDNAGAVSFPAALDTVIGIDTSFRCVRKNDYVMIKDSIVNFKAKGGNQRVAWTDPKYMITQGSSYACANFTAVICDLLHQGVPPENMIDELEKNARFVFTNKQQQPPDNGNNLFPINRAALFPYNKEMHSLVRFSDLLVFEIDAVYDVKTSGKIGKAVTNEPGQTEYTIKSIDHCDWESIDTLIIGHTQELELILNQHIKQDLIEKCLQYNINIYSFDQDIIAKYQSELTANGVSFYFPQITAPKQNRLGKLYRVKSPVLGIFGTSSKQGKFTLQLHLRRLFLNNGYSVAQLGSEPQSLLFGFDCVYPFGYRSGKKPDTDQNIELLNEEMFRLDQKNPDIILVGSQSGAVPMLYNHIYNFTMESIGFLWGTRPDAVVLNINYHDQVSDIRRTVAAIESLGKCKVIALCLFPVGYLSDWDMIRDQKKPIDNALLHQFSETLAKTLGVNCYVLGQESAVNGIYQDCIDFFSR